MKPKLFEVLLFCLSSQFSLFNCDDGEEVYTISYEFPEILNNISELPFDENGHLSLHFVVYSEILCSNDIVDTLGESLQEQFIRYIPFSRSALPSLWPVDNESCTAVYLERGIPAAYIEFPFPHRVFTETNDSNILSWLMDSVLAVEIGFVSYLPNHAEIFWIPPTVGETPIKAADLGYAEINTAWITTFLGHQFEVIDSVTGELYGIFTAEYNGFYPLGDAGTFVGSVTDTAYVEEQIRESFYQEFNRYKRVKRTFTELGFKKGRLPNDVWGSVQAYYHNNGARYVREEYENNGFSINWHERDPFMVGMPWKLKTYWQTRLRDLVQNWIGNNVTLENTDIYGMRRYEDGARLLSHVDREATHAASLIVNVAQSNIREPWTVEIYDHADRLHEIEMSPGDIVYYESARCLHGRMKPLRGDYYVNLFTHYRPIGDPQWYLKPNPEGTVAPLIDLKGDCYMKEDNTQYCDPPITLPTLSPTGHVIRSAEDLFEYWKQVSPNQLHGDVDNEEL